MSFWWWNFDVQIVRNKFNWRINQMTNSWQMTFLLHCFFFKNLTNKPETTAVLNCFTLPWKLDQSQNTRCWFQVSGKTHLCSLPPFKLWFTVVAIIVRDISQKKKDTSTPLWANVLFRPFFWMRSCTSVWAHVHTLQAKTSTNPLTSQQAHLLCFRFEWPISQMCLFSV